MPRPRALYASDRATSPPKQATAKARVRAMARRRSRRPGPPARPWSRRGSLATLELRPVESSGDPMCSMEVMRRLSLTATVVAAVAGFLGPPANAANPLAGQRIFIDCEAATEQSAPQFNSWYWFHHYEDTGNGSKASLIGKIAKVPVAKWFSVNSIRPTPTKLEDRLLARVDHPKV